MRVLCVVLALALAGCIEDRLSVDVLTQIQSDGTCTRRIEYRIERIDPDHGGKRVEIPPAEDRLRQFRIPAAEPWRTREQQETGFHSISVEAQLPSPAAADGDFYRARGPKAAPARNFVSAFTDPEHGRYEYLELLRDPASPLAGARMLSRLALKSDEAFAARFTQAIADTTTPPRDSELRRMFRDLFATPFAREVAALAEQPMYGPRERRALDAILDALTEKQRDLAARILAAVPGAQPKDVESATDKAIDALGDVLLAQVEAAGLPFGSQEGFARARFHATLVMPAPIVRANTCATGDTAEWEFDEEDMFGRGFEMKAEAAFR